MSACAMLFFGIALVLGVMHEGELLGEVSIVLVKRFKQQAGALVEVGSRLKDELTTWDTDSKDHEHSAKPPEERRDAASSALESR